MDGKNHENELVRMLRESMVRTRMVRMVILQNRERDIMVRVKPPNGGNSHINLHVSWVTLGYLGVRSSPLGFCSYPQRNLGYLGLFPNFSIFRKYIIIFPWIKPTILAPIY